MRIKLWKRPLLPHQQETFDGYCQEHRHLAIFHEMRLGKTLLTIRWVKALPDRPLRILVLAPISPLGGWERELKLEGEVFLSEYGTRGRKYRALDAYTLFDTDIKKRVWFLTNYQALHNTNIHYLPWDVVIADESTALKSPSARITKEACLGFRGAKHRAILSGLPNPESDLDLITQYIFLLGEFMGERSFWSWRARNCYATPYGEYGMSRRVRQELKTYVHQTASVLRRKEVGLGSRIFRERRDILTPPALIKAFKQMRRDFEVCLNDEVFQTKWTVTLEMWYARLCGGFDPAGNLVSDHKLVELVDLLTGELKNEQVIVGFRFNAEIEEAQKRLGYRDIDAPVMWGMPGARDRHELEREFLKEKHRIMLVQSSLDRGLRGINLASASTIVHYSLHWSNEINAQLDDRIINPMKKEPGLIMYLTSKGTKDEEVVEAIQQKRLNSKLLLTQLRKEMGL